MKCTRKTKLGKRCKRTVKKGRKTCGVHDLGARVGRALKKKAKKRAKARGLDKNYKAKRRKAKKRMRFNPPVEDVTLITIRGSEVVLGDAIKVIDSPYGWATVVKIEGNDATVFRPFVHIGDFTYTGGVLHYIGTETFTLALEGRSYEVDQSTHERMAKSQALK